MKFRLEINMDGKMFKRDSLFKLMMLLTDVTERLDAQWISGSDGVGIIRDNDGNTIGDFGII